MEAKKSTNLASVILPLGLTGLTALTLLTSRRKRRIASDTLKSEEGKTSKATPNPKGASSFTRKANMAMYDKLPFDDMTDFELVERGLIAREESLVIRDDDGKVVWDMDQFTALLDKDAPDTANPSLWRQSQLLSRHGLYKVTDRIYQIRGYDTSVMTVVEGETGWIVIDPLISIEVAAAGMKLVEKHLGKKPVVAVIYTHSHVDHFGGVKGIVSVEDVRAGKVQILAPEGFTKECMSENSLAGNAMSRRAQYQFGMLLPIEERGNVGVGLGLSSSKGTVSLILPTDCIPGPEAERIVDGVPIRFLDTPGAEAPVEFIMYFPKWKALCVAEEANATMHNLYTLRGAQVRNGQLWAHWLDRAIDRFGSDLELVFGSHHWPRWGQDASVDYLEKQRDMYKYLHDQTLRMANQGLTSPEIAEELELPDSLSNEFFNRGYYGTVKHNARAQYQLYLGWFDGNPANLDPLPPVESSKRMVEMMGGPDRVIDEARVASRRGEYRWAAQLLNHVVFAHPENVTGRYLQADAFEQLGYQSESGIWRSFYLTGAKELRDGVDPQIKVAKPSSDIAEGSVTPDLVFEELSIHVNGMKAGRMNKKGLVLNFDFTDSNGPYTLVLKNGVLHHKSGLSKDAAVTVKVRLSDLIAMLQKQADMWALIRGGKVKVEGNPLTLAKFFMQFEDYDKWFNIVTP